MTDPKKSCLTSKAVLCNLTIKVPKKQQEDKEETRKLREKAAGRDVISAHKKLFTKEAFADIMTVIGKARKLPAQYGFPWGLGIFLVPLLNYEKLNSALVTLKVDFEKLAQEKVDKYESMVEEAKTLLGDLFNPADYPSKEIFAKKFGFSFDIYPVPASDHFVLQAEAELIQKFQESVDEKIKETEESFSKHLLDRIIPVVSKMAEDFKGKDKNFHKSLIGNIDNIIDLVPALNILNDPKIAEFAEEIKRKLTNVSMDTLKKDKGLRAEKAETASDIVNRMSSYYQEVK